MQGVKVQNKIDQYVVRALLYYDIFNYPLKGSEVFRFLGMNSITEADVLVSLHSLVERGLVAQMGEYYSVRFDMDLVRRRVKGNNEARGYYSLAQKKARFISRFPFVRGVMGSGSLSKDYMDDNCDLDFFIVTSPGRLWIARTFLVLYKRVFLRNSHKHFCVNYFVDEGHLEIEEKNLFTATELATVLPLHGVEYYERLHDANRHWVRLFLPNYQRRESNGIPSGTIGVFKKVVESILNFMLASKWEKLLMTLTYQRWRHLYGESYSQDDFAVAFKTKEYASKNHPRNFQKRILDVYSERLSWFKDRGVALDHE